MKLWGEEKSRPYIQSFHFGFSIGAFLAPIIAAPFLEKASNEVDGEPNCPNKIVDTTISPFTEPTNYYQNTTYLKPNSKHILI